MPKKPEKTCFVIAPIGKEGSEPRKWSDQVMELIIRPAGAECGYKVERADDIQESGAITSQVIQRCANVDLVVANLTDNNPNVFYELALRHAIGKPVIQLIQKGQPIPFDVGPMRTIFYDKETPTTFRECKNDLIEFMKNIDLEKPVLDNPITSSLGLIELQASSNPLEHATSNILSLLQDILSSVKGLRSEGLGEKRLGSKYLSSLEALDAFDDVLRLSQTRFREGECDICKEKRSTRIHLTNPLGSLKGIPFLWLCAKCATDISDDVSII